MALKPAQAVPVATIATILTATDKRGDYAAAATSVLLTNSGSVVVAIGGSQVTATTGYRLAVGRDMTVDLQAGEVLYGIVASGTGSIDVFQTGM
jgi:hypothetical protein